MYLDKLFFTYTKGGVFWGSLSLAIGVSSGINRSIFSFDRLQPTQGDINLKKLTLITLVAAVVLTMYCGMSSAGSLERGDRKMVGYFRGPNIARVYPQGINGRFFSTFVNPRDSAGFMIYDEWYRVIESLRYFNGDSILLPDITFWEEESKLMAVSDSLSIPALIFLAAKRNQATISIGPEEARTTPSQDLNRLWPLVTERTILQTGLSWIERSRPYQLNGEVVDLFHAVPDTVLSNGKNPARFKYMVVCYSASPIPGDTLFFEDLRPNCSKVAWTANDLNDPITGEDYPIPTLPPFAPEPDQPYSYRIDAASLGITPMDYGVTVNTPTMETIPATVLFYGTGWSVTLPASDFGKIYVLNLKDGNNLVKQAHLGAGDMCVLPPNLVYIPEDGGQDQW